MPDAKPDKITVTVRMNNASGAHGQIAAAGSKSAGIASHRLHGRASKAVKNMRQNHAWSRKRKKNQLDHRGSVLHLHPMPKTNDSILDGVINPVKK